MKLLLCVIDALLLILCMCFVSATWAQNNIGSGAAEKLYLQHCASCHGKNLKGGMAPSMLDDEWRFGGSDEQITKSIVDGAPQLGMPGWKSILSAEQIRSLVIYIREVRQLEVPPAAPVSLNDKTFRQDQYTYALKSLAKGTGILWGMDFMPEGEILITQRDGVLWQLNKEGKLVHIKGTPEVWDHGQGGLLDVAVHPNYKENGWIYLSFSESGGKERGQTAGMTAVVRGKIKEGQWRDEEEIYRAPPDLHTSARVHFGSRIVLRDGYIFFSIGDRGRKDMAQELDKPNGKIHRLLDNGSIPKDNPFVGEKNAIKSIWSYGHRNPQGLIDAGDGAGLWETEHGPRGGDEVNFIEKGKNYGWPVITYGMNYSGSPITDKTAAPGMLQPVHYWTPSIAVTGIALYNGDEFKDWSNSLLVVGLASEELHRLSLSDRQIVEDTVLLKGQGRIRDVAVGPNNKIYLLISNSSRIGSLYRLDRVSAQVE